MRTKNEEQRTKNANDERRNTGTGTRNGGAKNPRRSEFRVPFFVRRSGFAFFVLRSSFFVQTLVGLAGALVLVGGATAQSSEPRRIISLVPALTEMVFAIGAGDRVVAVSSYDDYPPQVRALPRVGALLDPDTERIIALRPDLVMVYGSQTDLMTQLKRASIPFFEYRHAGFAGITSTIRAIGQRLGRSSAAESVAAGIERHFAEIRSRTATLPKPRTLLVFGRERGALRNIYASGGRGFLHDMLESAGGTNVFADIMAESVQASSELILTRAPEVVIELHTTSMLDDRDRAQEIRVWSTLASLPAVRNRRIYLLSRKGLSVPGPGVADNTEEFFKVLHPR